MSKVYWHGVGFQAVPLEQAHLITTAGNYNLCRWETWVPLIHGVLYTGEAGNIGDRYIDHIGDGRIDDARAMGASHLLVSTDFPRIGERYDLETVLRFELSPPLNRELPPLLETAFEAAKRLKLYSLIYRYGAELAERRARREGWGRGALTTSSYYGQP